MFNVQRGAQKFKFTLTIHKVENFTPEKSNVDKKYAILWKRGAKRSSFTRFVPFQSESAENKKLENINVQHASSNEGLVWHQDFEITGTLFKQKGKFKKKTLKFDFCQAEGDDLKKSKIIGRTQFDLAQHAKEDRSVHDTHHIEMTMANKKVCTLIFTLSIIPKALVKDIDHPGELPTFSMMTDNGDLGTVTEVDVETENDVDHDLDPEESRVNLPTKNEAINDQNIEDEGEVSENVPENMQDWFTESPTTPTETIEDLRLKLQELKKKHQEELSSMKKNFEARNAQIEKELNSLQAVKNEYGKWEEKLASLKQINDELSSSNSEYEKKRRNMENELSKSRKEKEKIEALLLEERKVTKSLQQEKSILEDAYATLQISQLELRAEKLKQEEGQLLNDQPSSQIIKEKKNLEERLSTLQKENDSLKELIEVGNKRIQSFTQEIDSHKAALAKLKQNDSTNSELITSHTNIIEKLKKEKESTSSQVTFLSKERDGLLSTVQSLENEKLQLQCQIETLSKENSLHAGTSEKLLDATKQLAEKVSLIAELQQENASLEKKVEKLKSKHTKEILSLKKELENQKEVDKQATTVEDSQVKKIEILEESNTKLKHESKSLEKQKLYLQKSLEDLQLELQIIKKQSDHFENVASELRNENEELEKQINSLQSSLSGRFEDKSKEDLIQQESVQLKVELQQMALLNQLFQATTLEYEGQNTRTGLSLCSALEKYNALEQDSPLMHNALEALTLEATSKPASVEEMIYWLNTELYLLHWFKIRKGAMYLDEEMSTIYKYDKYMFDISSAPLHKSPKFMSRFEISGYSKYIKPDQAEYANMIVNMLVLTYCRILGYLFENMKRFVHDLLAVDRKVSTSFQFGPSHGITISNATKKLFETISKHLPATIVENLKIMLCSMMDHYAFSEIASGNVAISAEKAIYIKMNLESVEDSFHKDTHLKYGENYFAWTKEACNVISLEMTDLTPDVRSVVCPNLTDDQARFFTELASGKSSAPSSHKSPNISFSTYYHQGKMIPSPLFTNTSQ